MEEKIIWKPVKGFEGLYELSETGIVRSLQRKVQQGTRTIKPQQLKPRINNCGYLNVRLSKEGRKVIKYLHVLLAEAFIPNPDYKKEVNHKDGNKLNNDLDNLEWMTHAENVQHAYDKGLIILKTKPVIDTCTGKIFISVKVAAIVYNIKYGTLRNYLSGNIKNNKTSLQYAA